MNIEAFWQAVLTQDAKTLETFFHPQAVIRWHCSNEEFTVKEFVRANCEYPGEWDGKIERIHRLDDLIITAVHVYTKDKSAHFHVTSFMQLRDGKIEALDEYWGDDGPAPAWRQEMHIGRPLREGK